VNRERVIWHLENWSAGHDIDDTKLGWNKKSSVFSSGGGNSDEAFQIMCEQVDIQNAELMEVIINDLRKPYKDAIHHVWLKAKLFWPTHDMDYEIALETIMKVADRKGII